MPHNHFTRTPSDNKSRSSEPEQQSRGLWIPADILVMLEQGLLSSTEVLLLATIDSYVRCRGEGCWASHRKLGQQLGGLTKNHISDTIKKLKKDGLIAYKGWKITDKGRFRLIETVWSRIDVGGVYGKNSTGGVRKKQYGGVRKNPGQSNTVDDNKLRRSQARGAEGASDTISVYAKMASTIYKGLVAANKVMRPPRMKSWEDKCRSLVKSVALRNKTEVDAALRYVTPILSDHLENIKDRYQPQAYSPAAILDKWPNIEEAYKRRRDMDGDEDISDLNNGKRRRSIYAQDGEDW